MAATCFTIKLTTRITKLTLVQRKGGKLNLLSLNLIKKKLYLLHLVEPPIHISPYSVIERILRIMSLKLIVDFMNGKTHFLDLSVPDKSTNDLYFYASTKTIFGFFAADVLDKILLIISDSL